MDRGFWGVAALATAVAVTGGAVVAVRGASNRGVATLQAARLASAEPASPTPADEPTPTATPTPDETATPTPTTTTTAPTDSIPTATAEPTPTASPTTAEPEPGVLAIPSAIRLPTATKMSILVRWRTRPGILVRLDYGDGHARELVRPSCYGPDWPQVVTTDGAWSEMRVPWSYRVPGTYEVRAEVVTDPCGSGKDFSVVERSPRAPVVVTPGAVVGNGPHLPLVRIESRDDPDATEDIPYRLWFAAAAREVDGYLAKTVLTYGDGSEPLVHAVDVARECAANDYPATTWPWGGQGGSYGDHVFPGPGTYEVTVTVHSVGCDGGDEQTASASVTVTFD